MRVALDVRVRQGPRSSFVRVSDLLEAAAAEVGLALELWMGGACTAEVLWSPLLDPDPIPSGPRLVATLHDVQPLLPDSRPPLQHAWRAWRFRRRMRSAIRRTAMFAVVSEDSRARAEHFFPELRGRMQLVPHFPAPSFRPQDEVVVRAVLARRALPMGCVLFVAALRRHKNWDGALRAWAALPSALRERHPLVFAGSSSRGAQGVRTLARSLGVPEPHLLGPVEDAELASLYSSCAVFLFPSRQEGFGLPPLEAMACGAPVVASRCTAMPEVLGDAADYGMPEDPLSYVAPLRRLLEDPAWRAQRSADALARAAEFHARRTGTAMRELLLAFAQR